MNETKEEVDVDYDEIEQPTVAIEFNLDVKKVIVGWTLLFVAYFALSLESYNWNTFLLQTAIVVGAGMLILVIYERAGGNVVELPTVDWKGFMQAVVSLIIVIAALLMGSVLLSIGLFWMYDTFSYVEFRLLLAITVIAVGAGLVGLAYRELKELLGEDDEDALIKAYLKDEKDFEKLQKFIDEQKAKQTEEINKDAPLIDESTELKELITEDAAGGNTNESD